ncbi:MAG: cytochrome c oxidase accessory protein CcoG [Saprospiraceae bacterium]|nr:cytochrome c oxidase accessory protein CcoG [Saprospiraceae bacterium]MCF8251217.1 cytochrome c oxidase accessory protein CcoG [Saprospiraceae bacterium]MCF8281201.1 cytochrome c oxidase accessory protein CcoG [Bacteroidales bacterium]MCF8313159.1 cytochrome c oxidase accessory protein CcoG [Saprospiraceae bacterium]MCF8441579.1 cytochrome c oxidase accessory protein CcoG [Saprospiraceae bacterium]
MNIIDELYHPDSDRDTEEYRDHLATVDKKGKRVWMYPKKPSGWFYKARTWLSFVLLGLLFGMPFIRVNGEPLMLFDVLERKFIIFSIVFTPQDLHLFALAMVTLMLFVVLFTVVFGRLFCGWICPQTIFMEMVFRKIEYWIDGDAGQQRKLAAAPWTGQKIFKRLSKYAIFYAISLIIANTFLMYVIGSDKVLKIATDPIGLHLGGFMALLAFSGVFFFVFSYMREQVCIAICPYGRLQGVLLVPDSIVVHYDYVRGEPRGKISKQSTVELPTAKGDCVDCKLCVHVCPTGIDIRNGTQLECVNCTACMDACDGVMEKVNRPKGLIRYDSETGIKADAKGAGSRKIFTTRVWAYTGVLVALIALQAFLFATRSEVETVLLRTPGQLFQKVEGGYLSNLYNYEVINKTGQDIPSIEFKLVGAPGGRIKLVGDASTIVPKQGMVKGVMFIEMPEKELESRKTKLKIEVWSNGKLVDEAKTNFLGPVK